MNGSENDNKEQNTNYETERKQITFSISNEQFNQQVIALRPHAVMNGFRKGKMPLHLIAAQFRKQILDSIVKEQSFLHLQPFIAQNIFQSFKSSFDDSNWQVTLDLTLKKINQSD